MENTNLVIAPTDESKNITSAPHQIEDTAHKITAQFFGTELLSHLQIEGEIDHIGPTEITHLDLTTLITNWKTTSLYLKMISFHLLSVPLWVEISHKKNVFKKLSSL